MCMIDDADSVTTVDSGDYRRARKEHKCMECMRVITVGESYHSESFVFEGKFTQHKTCGHCMVARGWLQDECGGWIYGSVEEDVREHCQEGYGHPIGVYRLAVGMQQLWRRKDGSLRLVPSAPPTTHERMKNATTPGDPHATE